MVIKGFRVWPLLRATGREILEDNVLGLAAQTAYYFFFSLFPLFLFAAPLLSLIGDKQEITGWLMGQLATVVPGDAIDLVRGVVRDVVFAENAPGIISLGALLAAWAGSAMFNALIGALNRAYDVEETRPWWKKRLVALASVAAAGTMLLIASVVMLAGPEITNWLEDRTTLGRTFTSIWFVLQYPLAFSFLVATMWLVYYFLPNLRQDKTQILAGAVVAAVLWILVTLVFRAYVSDFGSYNKTYGTIGGVIVLLTWMYLTMLVILSGGELNSELHHGTASLDPRRGAVYDGRVVTALEPRRASNERVEHVG